MIKKSRVKKNMFFLESILIIFMFSLVSAYVIKMFVGVEVVNNFANDQLSAMANSGLIISEIKTSDRYELDKDIYYYDADWIESNENNYSYYIKLDIEREYEEYGVLNTYNINTFNKNGDYIWDISYVNYFPLGENMEVSHEN